MKTIAIPARDGKVDDHFGHCDHYTIIRLADNGTIEGQEELPSPQGCGCKSNIASTLQEMGVTLMLAGNMGEGAYNKLSQHGIQVVRGCSGSIDSVISAYQDGTLKDSGDACAHHDCHNTPSAGGLRLA